MPCGFGLPKSDIKPQILPIFSHFFCQNLRKVVKNDYQFTLIPPYPAPNTPPPHSYPR